MLKFTVPVTRFSISEPPDKTMLQALHDQAATQSRRWKWAIALVWAIACLTALLTVWQLPQVLMQIYALAIIGATLLPLSIKMQKIDAAWERHERALSPVVVHEKELNKLLWASPPKTAHYLQAVYSQERNLCFAEYQMLTILSQEERKGAM